VVLYQPRDEGAWMPLGLLAIGSGLPEENVVLVDGRFELAPEARVAELAQRAACLAVSVRTGPPLRDALRVSAAARAVNPRLTIVWGGPHATLSPESCLAAGPVDACVRGAGDGTLAALLAAVRCGRDLAGEGVATPGAAPVAPREPPAPEQVPRVDYSLLDVERHFEARGVRRLDYCASRGSREGAFSGLAPERVAAELGELADRHGLAEVLFHDEDFYADAGRTEALLAALAGLAPRLGWRARLRLDDVLAGGHDRLRMLSATGCRALQLAVPPGVPARGGLRERALDAALLVHAAGIPARFEISIASPGKRGESLDAAISLARAICALDPRFETPLRRTLELPDPPAEGASLEAWIARAEAPWADGRSERRLVRTAFFVGEAQRPPGRRIGQHLLRMLALLRVRLGFFALDLERLAVDASAVLRTGRPRSPRPAD
jgi:hypothetical protein